VHDGKRGGGTHAALCRYAELHLQIGQGASALPDATADFSVGDGIAEADVHDGGRWAYECELLSFVWFDVNGDVIGDANRAVEAQ
jgi:hypothetical protein